MPDSICSNRSVRYAEAYFYLHKIIIKRFKDECKNAFLTFSNELAPRSLSLKLAELYHFNYIELRIISFCFKSCSTHSGFRILLCSVVLNIDSVTSSLKYLIGRRRTASPLQTPLLVVTTDYSVPRITQVNTHSIGI